MSSPEKNGTQLSHAGTTKHGRRRKRSSVPAATGSAGGAPADALSSSQPRLLADEHAATDSHRKQRRRRKHSKGQESTAAELSLSSASVLGPSANPSTSASSAVSGAATAQETLSSNQVSLLAKPDSSAAGKDQPRPSAVEQATARSHRKQSRSREHSRGEVTTTADPGLSSASAVEAQGVPSPSASSVGCNTAAKQETPSSRHMSSVWATLLAKRHPSVTATAPVQEVANEAVEPPRTEVSASATGVAAEQPKDNAVVNRSPRRSLASKSSRTSSQRSTRESIKALNILLQDARAHAASVTEPSPRTASRRHLLMKSLQVKLLVAALICIVLVAFSLFLYSPKDKKCHTYCATKSCSDHRRLIENQLNESLNPCDDFAAYVCGRWTPRKEFSELSRSALMDMVMAWLKKLRATLESSADLFPAGRKAAAMFNSCMTQTGSQVEVVKNFMRKHGLVWPEDPRDDIGPLEVLIDLAFNWNVNLWFSLKLLPRTSDDNQKRRIFMTPNDLILQWRTVFTQIPRPIFEKVYSNIFRLFNRDVDKAPARMRIAEDYNMLKYIFDVFLSSARKARVPEVFPLRDFEKHTERHLANYIRDSLMRMTRISPRFTMDDLVMFSDMALLKAIIHIFHSILDPAVRLHLTCLFLHAYAAVANPAAVLLVLHGDQRLAEAQRPIFCAGQVEASYRLLVSAMAAVAYYPEEERRRIDSHLAGIVEMAIEKTTAASWLDNQTTETAVQKLKDMRTILWPPEKFLTAQGLEEYYANFTESASSFADFWIDTRRSLRRLVGSDLGSQELRIRDGTAEPYVEYLHVLNEVSISLGALVPPLYYKEGTKAMLYGGLGYFYAMEMVGAVDQEGVKVDERGNFISSWLSETVKPIFEDRVLKCLPRSIFPEVPAMEVAFSAFKRDHDIKDAQLSDALTEEKVFFITACLPSCARTAADNLYGGDCNKAVSNFPPFARTFQCPQGSKMNPVKKCTFFD